MNGDEPELSIPTLPTATAAAAMKKQNCKCDASKERDGGGSHTNNKFARRKPKKQIQNTATAPSGMMCFERISNLYVCA